jgi:hypothetical protein
MDASVHDVSPSHLKGANKSPKPKKASSISAEDVVTPAPRAWEVDSATLAAQSERARKEKLTTRRQLEARLRWLLSELEITEKAIVDDDLATARSPTRVPTNLSVAEVTRHVLAHHPRGASSTVIVREVQAAKPDADPKAVHAELRHARKTGTRRNFRYFPPPVEGHEAEEQDGEVYVTDPSEERAP